MHKHFSKSEFPAKLTEYPKHHNATEVKSPWNYSSLELMLSNTMLTVISVLGFPAIRGPKIRCLKPVKCAIIFDCQYMIINLEYVPVGSK